MLLVTLGYPKQNAGMVHLFIVVCNIENPAI